MSSWFWLELVLWYSSRGGLSYAQPNIPKEKIPSDVPSDVRKQIERLYSSDPIERAYGALALGKIGGKAAPAVPFLIGILGDHVGLAWSSGYGGVPTGPSTSPSAEAADALREIEGPRAVEGYLGSHLNY